MTGKNTKSTKKTDTQVATQEAPVLAHETKEATTTQKTSQKGGKKTTEVKESKVETTVVPVTKTSQKGGKKAVEAKATEVVTQVQTEATASVEVVPKVKTQRGGKKTEKTEKAEKKEATEAKTSQKGGRKAKAKAKVEKKETTETKEDDENGDKHVRSFKVKLPNSETFEGRFTGLTPYQAANKALSKYFREVKNATTEVTFSICESTRNSKKNVYTYNGSRHQLEVPVKYTIQDGREIVKNFKNSLKKIKKTTTPASA